MMDAVQRLTSALEGRYRLERELGQGGMATVYLAQDLRHDRKVALKVLRPELAAVIGAERFLAEIKTTANLQHPHILPLFDSGRTGGKADGPTDDFLFYVMPFVEGETLRDRLNREKQLPIPDVVRIATEVASALDYAHRHGVIHRDIKPENILLHDGRAQVADFGIALAANKAGGSRMTETGMSLGTPHYMSPEQAMGERELDARSDVYALGAMTYECLTGEPPFTGPTAQAIVAKVMTATPEPVTTLRKTVPPHVADAVHQAIEKLPADRFATAAAFGAALAGGGTTTRRHDTAATRRLGDSATRPLLWRMGILAAGFTVLAFFAGRRMSGDAAGSPAVYDAALPDSAPMLFAATTARVSYGYSIRSISVSPSGDFAVYTAREGDSTALWYRSLRDGTVRPIPGTAGGTAPRVAPDGARVAFLLRDRVMVAPIAGGEARQILKGESMNSVDWVSATELVVTDSDGNRVHWLDAEGGTRRTATITRCALAGYVPEIGQMLCSYNRYAQLFDPETGNRWTIRSTRPDGSPGSAVAGSAFRLVDRRYLVYVAIDGSLLAARYDPATHLAGRPVALVSGVRREGIGEAHYDISATGLLVYAPGVDAAVGHLVRLQGGGTPTPLPVEAGDFQRYDLSRDRRWLAVVAQTAEGNELRIYDLRDRQRFTWLTGELVRHPLWNTNGEQILTSVRDSTRWLILRGSPSSGVRPDTLAWFDEQSSGGDFSTNLDPVDFHDDHSALLQDWSRSLVARFDPGRSPLVLDTILTGVRFPSVSPNGKLIVYQNQEGSRIVVTGFPVPGRRWQVASEGVEPLWLSGTEVLYRSGVSWYLVRLNAETGEPLGAPTLWARDPRFSDTSGWSNRPSWDGGIIYVQGPAQTSTAYLRVVPDWVAQMKSAADAAGR